MRVTVATQPGIDALAADGGVLRLRPVTPEDAVALTELYERGSADSLRLRFFGVPGRSTVATEVERLVRPVADDHYVVVAEQAGVLIGVASYERCPLEAPVNPAPADTAMLIRAEFAVFVDEAHHGRGVGTLLLEHLAASARRRGVTELVGEVLVANTGMLRVAHDLSARSSGFDHGVVDVGLLTAIDEGMLEVADARDRTAERASLRPLFAPRNVAVVGAGREPGGIGHAVLESLVEFGFVGQVYAVNPHATTIAGVPSYPSLTAIPDPVDLAVISLPATAVAGVLADAATAGVRRR